MTVTHNSKPKELLDKLLTSINRLLWPSDETADGSKNVFYCFKPYPNGIKLAEISQWAKLQETSLSPFQKGDFYSYLSSKGIHIWFSPKALEGIPETALQEKLSSGTHFVAGNKTVYKQVWSNGIMLSCNPINSGISSENAVLPINCDKGKHWAVTRTLDTKLVLPSTWIKVSLFAILCGFIWWTAGYATTYIQRHQVQVNTQALSDQLGTVLSNQTKLRNDELTYQSVSNWQREYGFFPEAFAMVAKRLSSQGEWSVQTVSWQDKTMELEFSAENIDIAQLINNLEQTKILEKVNIRPHLAENIWILEATFQ